VARRVEGDISSVRSEDQMVDRALLAVLELFKLAVDP